MVNPQTPSCIHEWIGFPHSSTSRGYLKIVKELLAHNRLNYVSTCTNCSMTLWDRPRRSSPNNFDWCFYHWKRYNSPNARNVGTDWARRLRKYDPLKHRGQLIQRHSVTFREYLNLQQQKHHYHHHHRRSLMSRKTGFCYITLCLYLVTQPYHFLNITRFFYINKTYIYFYKKITPLTLTENIITPVTEYTR